MVNFSTLPRRDTRVDAWRLPRDNPAAAQIMQDVICRAA
jgi:hypothetical protein